MWAAVQSALLVRTNYGQQRSSLRDVLYMAASQRHYYVTRSSLHSASDPGRLRIHVHYFLGVSSFHAGLFDPLDDPLSTPRYSRSLPLYEYARARRTAARVDAEAICARNALGDSYLFSSPIHVGSK